MTGRKKSVTPMQRFWEKVDTSGECWNWTGSRYGGDQMRGSFSFQRKTVTAYRWLWERIYGPIPAGRFLLHNCDNGLCVRLSHLRVGTQLDNMRDKYEHGRSHHRVLTVDQVRELRILRVDGMSLPALGRRFGVTHQSVHAIVQGRTHRMTDRPALTETEAA